MGAVKNIICASYMGADTAISWNFIFAVAIIGILLGAVVYKTYFEKKKSTLNKMSKVVDEVIALPMSGRLMAITDVPDPIFSEKMVGDGFAIEPNENNLYAPVSGTVMQIYSNKDALTIKTNAGRDVILHIGVNTSNLRGEGISYRVKEGDTVEAGEWIGRIDLEIVVPRISSVISPVVFPNLTEHEHIILKRTGMVEAKLKDVVVIETE